MPVGALRQRSYFYNWKISRSRINCLENSVQSKWKKQNSKLLRKNRCKKTKSGGDGSKIFINHVVSRSKWKRTITCFYDLKDSTYVMKSWNWMDSCRKSSTKIVNAHCPWYDENKPCYWLIFELSAMWEFKIFDEPLKLLKICLPPQTIDKFVR